MPFFVLSVGLMLHQPTDQPKPIETTEQTTQNPHHPIASKDTEPQGWVVAADDKEGDEGPFVSTRSTDQWLEKPTLKKLTDLKRNKNSHLTIDNKTYPVRTYRMLALPNDPLASQWWVTDTNLDTTWSAAPGSYQTTIAIIDSGFALDHEEFEGRWYENGDEQGATTIEGVSALNCSDRNLPLDYSCNLVDDDVDGVVDNETGVAPYENPSQLNCSDQGIPLTKSCNRIDDDNNGYIDDVRGWDVINQDNSVQAGELSPQGEGTTHGTMVAGTAAATGNNGKGIAGVNWHTKLLPIQALDDDGYGDTRSVGQAIRYAIDRGVDVINISLGTDYQDDYVRESIELATARGIVVVASSGNDGCECVAYPARYPEVVAIGATDNNGAKASFSSWGPTIDLVAPGTGFTLPTWTLNNQSGGYASNVAGTSFSSPLVAGAVALIKSHQPEASPLQLIAALRETTERSHNTPISMPNTLYGFGTVDVNAYRERMVTPKHLEQGYIFSPVNAGNFFTDQPLREPAGQYRVEICSEANTGLPVYELKTTGRTFYTVSEVERRKALALGFTGSNFAYGCLIQPHDTNDSLRIINIFREFRNLTIKP